ncbi:hypothetical protein Taro_034089 [Colocasia esculenta]|uniref:Uncharacterized protein n=1 Tax=Colocasia esculenta TaxID=4460 RepID=A0A843W1W6_COLES|nr:hypothetical protein [Colocasia esculenta]
MPPYRARLYEYAHLDAYVLPAHRARLWDGGICAYILEKILFQTGQPTPPKWAPRIPCNDSPLSVVTTMLINGHCLI